MAVKQIPVHELMGEQGFRQELAALRAVRHEHVLPVLAYNERGDPEGNQYLVMPLMEGGDLAVAMVRMNGRDRCTALLAV